jgi:hypothetical protein
MLHTNVLIYAYNKDAPQYPAAFLLRDRVQEASASLIFETPPNLREP